jgi:hypothetical protein
MIVCVHFRCLRAKPRFQDSKLDIPTAGEERLYYKILQPQIVVWWRGDPPRRVVTA